MRATDGRRDPGPSRRDILRLGVAAWAGPGLLAALAGGAEEKAGRIYAFAEFPDLDKPVEGIIAIDPERATWELIPGTEMASQHARVTPDGRFLAYAIPPIAGPARTGVWVRPVRGEFEPIRISTGRCWPVCWSGDAEQLILFIPGRRADVRQPDRPPILSQYVRVNADGSHPLSLPFGERDYVGDWSSDGQWLLVNTIPRAIGDSGRHVYLSHPDGTGRRLIYEEDRDSPGRDDIAIGFTPDGHRIAFRQIISSGTTAASWTVDLQGKDRRPIPLKEDDIDFAWSPDGSRLAVGFRDPEPDGERNSKPPHRLAIMDADGGDRRFLALPRTRLLVLLDWRPEP